MAERGDAYEEDDLLEDYYGPEPEPEPVFGDGATDDAGIHPGDRADYLAIAIDKLDRGIPLDESEKKILALPPFDSAHPNIEHGTKLVVPASNADSGIVFKKNGTGQPSKEVPTAEDPLRGLKHLPKVALRGRERLLALAAEPISYVWEGIIVEGDIAVMSGEPGGGKTTAMFLLVVARANTGEPVTILGRRMLPAPEGKYLVLIEGEHGEGSTARKLIKSARMLHVDDSALDRIIIVARKAVTLGSPPWGDIVQLIRAGLVSDVVLDTLARVAPADANDEREQVSIFNLIAVAIESAPAGTPKPTAWVLTHNKKNGNGTMADISGSAQRVGQADAVLILVAERVEGRVVSSTLTFWKLREPPDDYPVPVKFIITKNSSGEPCLESTDASGEKEDDRPLETRIVDALRVEPRTQNALMEMTKRSWKDVGDALTNLFGQKAIRTTYVKVRGKNQKAFELRDATVGAPSKATQPHDEFDELFDDGGNTP